MVLPGVGAFAACWRLLHARPGLVEAMTAAVKGRGAPFLGVCVGLQLLATRGLEFGQTPGLDWIPARCAGSIPSDHALKVPHMGWNALQLSGRTRSWAATPPQGAHMYFTHSFALPRPIRPTCWPGPTTAGACRRGDRDNVAGVQFHPEKSQGRGLKLLGDFLEWRP